MSRLFLACLFLSALLQSPAAPLQTPGNNTSGAPVTPEPPGNNTSGGPVAPMPPDPAAVRFKSDSGVMLVAVKRDKTADYEAVVTALQELLAKTTDPDKRALAEGWKIYKAAEVDAQSSAIYVHIIQPTVVDADYRMSLLLDELLSGAPAELLAKYRDAFAAPPAQLALAELAHMSIAPVPKPSNASPAGPAAPGTPGNATAPAPTPDAAPTNTTPPKPTNTTPPKPTNTTPPKPTNTTPPKPTNTTPPKPTNTTPSGLAKPPPAPGNTSAPAPKKPPGGPVLRSVFSVLF